jgi:hypothetical protein
MSEYDNQNSLNDLDVATPMNGASPQELLLAIRQLKAIVKNALLVSHTPNGKLREGSFSNLSPNSVGTAQIQNDAVTVDKLADAAVTTEALIDEAVTADKLADGAVTEDKYGPASIPQSAFQDNTIPLSALAGFVTANYLSASLTEDSLRSVTSSAIANRAVTDRTVNDVAIGKLTGGIDNDMLLKIAGIWTAIPFGGGVSFNPITNEFEVNSGLKIAVVGDVKSRGSFGGVNAPSGTWLRRTLGEIADPFDLLTFSSNRFKLAVGKYLYVILVPACGVGQHQARLFDSTNTEPVAWGTPAQAFTATLVNSNSIIVGFQEVTDPNVELEVQHWMQSSAGNSQEMGYPASSDATSSYPSHSEVYTIGFLMKIS